MKELNQPGNAPAQTLKVAAYIRVSTFKDEQEDSYELQERYFTNLLEANPTWVSVGVYSDYAVTATSTGKRTGFKRLMRHCQEGKIDRIISKSISRFARNTLDTLDCVRQLREQNPPVGIYFEKENIDTLDATGELFLTILSAMAQDESRSISDNIRWAFQKRFQEGRPQINLNRMLGYDKGQNGEWLINEKQAETVRIIFKLYAEGKNASAIAAILNEENRLTVNEKQWCSKTILIVLHNEKYVGDLAMQKTITKSFLTHRSVTNTGEAPMYYVQNHHAPIIDRDIWDKVQLLLKRHGQSEDEPEETAGVEKKASSVHMSIFCAGCGAMFTRLGYVGIAKNYTDERSAKSEGADERLYSEKYTYRYDVYRCKTRINGDIPCSAENYCEIALQQSFMEAIYAIRNDYLQKGESSWICTQFAKNHKAADTLNSDVKNPLARPDIHKRFQLFTKCIAALPEPTADFYEFDKGLYGTFIIKGVARDDTVIYTTNFGVSIVTTANKRTLTDFVGKTHMSPDGSPETLSEEWQVNGKKLAYKRKERKRAKKQ